MGRFLIYFQYIGTRYRGVIRSSSFSSDGKAHFGVQDVLEKAFDDLNPVEPVRLHVSSRTDAGVHALCNTAHFDVAFKNKRSGELRDVPAESITMALNKKLHVCSQDVRIIKTLRVPDNFHSQHLALGRSYLYRIATGCRPIELPIFERNRCWGMEQRLNIDLMKEASTRLLGTHDFSAFRNVSCDDHRKSPVKTMDGISMRKAEGFLTHHCYQPAQLEFWEITFRSRSFLYRQVRRMTGALVAVGLGRITPPDITAILESRDNSHMHGTTMAPPHGLYLKEVLYNENDFQLSQASSSGDDTSIK